VNYSVYSTGGVSQVCDRLREYGPAIHSPSCTVISRNPNRGTLYAYNAGDLRKERHHGKPHPIQISAKFLTPMAATGRVDLLT
jgi:hypothetical protein